MLFRSASTKGATALFATKLGLVLAAVVVMKLTDRSVYGGNPEPAGVSGTARALAVISIFLWTAAIVTGRYMAYA